MLMKTVVKEISSPMMTSKRESTALGDLGEFAKPVKNPVMQDETPDNQS